MNRDEWATSRAALKGLSEANEASLLEVMDGFSFNEGCFCISEILYYYCMYQFVTFHVQLYMSLC